MPESGSRKRRERGRSGTEQHTAHQRNPGYSLKVQHERQTKAREACFWMSAPWRGWTALLAGLCALQRTAQTARSSQRCQVRGQRLDLGVG